MRVLSLVAILFSINTYSVVTKDCPESLTYKLTDIRMNGILDDEAWADDSSFAFDGWNDIGILRTQEYLAARDSIETTLELTFAGNAKCKYRGQDNDGKSIYADLRGSTRPNAKEPAVLVAYSSTYVVYINVDSVEQNGLTTSNNFASIYYRGEVCSWGDCIPDHISIGNAKIQNFQ